MTIQEEINWLEKYIKVRNKEGVDVTFLRAILARLKGLTRKEPPSPYHQQAMSLYFEWLRSHDLPAISNAAQGKALKEILQQLKQVSNDKTDEAAFLSFKVILQHWNRLNPSLAKIKTLANINKNLLEIIDKIKHGATKQQSNQMEANTLHDELSRKYSTYNG